MAKRLQSPDTEADAIIRECIKANPPQPFIVRAGAGSGKTTSLVKALASVLDTHGAAMRRKKQMIACITYTDLAAHEIAMDVNEDRLVHVSTIHSFYWAIVKSFQTDIKSWLRQRIETKLGDLQAEAAAFGARTRQATRDKNRRDTARYTAQREGLDQVTAFTYGMGSNYGKGVLGHDDVIKVANHLLHERPLFRRLVGLRFPFIFIDESQDTMDDVVESFRRVEQEMRGQFCLGFFGDPMQKIYLTGIGPISPADHWRRIDKPENYRCATRILDVANAVRAKGDGLQQVGGRTELVDGVPRPVEGTARMFVLPSSMDRREALTKVRNWIATANQDERWRLAGSDGPKVLVIVHRMAAERLGFGQIYAALNDRASDALRQGFHDGTAWPLRPFVSYLLPLAQATHQRNEFEAMNLLRAYSPRLQREALVGSDAASILRELRGAVSRLTQLLEPGGGSIREVLVHAQAARLLPLDDGYARRLELSDDARDTPGGPPRAGQTEPPRVGATAGAGVAGAEESDGSRSDDEQVAAFLECAASELWPYLTYLKAESAFATQHGVKGDEFDQVMVVMDDSESDFNLYSYEKYFGIVPPTSSDVTNQQRGLDNSLSRTGRLLYVCCTRAKRDLALVLFTEDAVRGREQALRTGILNEQFVFGADVLDVA